MKTGRRHGFLCHSHSSTAVCIPGNSRSVVVPRRPDRNTTVAPAGPPKLVDLKYSRLVQSGRYPPICTGERKPTSSNTSDIPTSEKNSPPTVTIALPTTAAETNNAMKPAVVAPPPSASSIPGDVFQVVVMRVSIHCQGCAYKIKKHISKMEGVTSFSVDLEKKRVMVMGHISPLAVLESISKVKKAEFWQA